MASKKPVVRCVQCGVKATRYIAHNKHSPVCDNRVCFTSRMDEMKEAIFQQAVGGTDVAHN